MHVLATIVTYLFALGLERKELEKNVDKALEKGKLEEIKEFVTPRNLLRCKTNCLMKALEVGENIRYLAKKQGSESLEFEKMAKHVEMFSCALMESCERCECLRKELKGNILNMLVDKAIATRQKKFLSRHVIFTLLMEKWYGRYFQMAHSAWNTVECWKWIMLSLWSVVDAILFPLVFAFLFVLRTFINTTPHGLGAASEDQYKEYFTTPCFLFLKDTLSYVALLSLHFAFCVEDSVVPFTTLEWVILVFFTGRVANEIYQLVQHSNWEKHHAKENRFGTCFRRKLACYFGDHWNVMDFVTILVYIVILVLRLKTWILDEVVSDNRNLTTAHYLYGLNTLLLTFRVFGHVMESKRGMGTMQIALFKIVDDVAGIFGQFGAAILAFSFTITKIYVAEKSFNSEKNMTSSFCRTEGMDCWWQTAKNLIWSLFGLVDLTDLDSSDAASVTIVLVIYVLYLILAVIMLVNMMVALLTNTYQKVRDHALEEWGYKKAVTIQTYSCHHPIMPPLNLISLPLDLVRRRCYKTSKVYITKEENEFKRFDDLVHRYLEPSYVRKYGSEFPLLDEDIRGFIHKELLSGTRSITSQIIDAFNPATKDLPVGATMCPGKNRQSQAASYKLQTLKELMEQKARQEEIIMELKELKEQKARQEEIIRELKELKERKAGQEEIIMELKDLKEQKVRQEEIIKELKELKEQKAGQEEIIMELKDLKEQKVRQEEIIKELKELREQKARQEEIIKELKELKEQKESLEEIIKELKELKEQKVRQEEVIQYPKEKVQDISAIKSQLQRLVQLLELKK